LLGVKDAKADGEIIVIAHALLAAFGATDDDFVIRLSSRPLLNAACTAAGLNAEATRAYLRLLDKGSKITVEEFKTALGAISNVDPIILIEDDDERIMAEKKKLLDLIEAFNKRGISNVVFDPTIVRGFDYYTGIIFEIFDTDPKNPRALFGGGRYDDLVSLFGGDTIPAVGFGMGDVTLADFLETHDLMLSAARTPEIYLGTPSEGDRAAANEAAEALRAADIRVFVNLTSKSLGDQVKDAARRGIPFFAAVGDAEKHSRTLRVKRLASGIERPLALPDVASYLRSA
jgi:histidyl-tRNA synthetase